MLALLLAALAAAAAALPALDDFDFAFERRAGAPAAHDAVPPGTPPEHHRPAWFVGRAVRAAERAALVDFYHALHGGEWFDRTRWLDGDPCTNAWRGIGCALDAKTGLWTVVSIKLPANGLRGTLPSFVDYRLYADRDRARSQVFEKLRLAGGIPGAVVRAEIRPHLATHFPAALPNMEEINLDDNFIAGFIPEAIGQMEQLLVLSLRANLVTGSIPAALGELKKLQFLDLGGNMLTGCIPPELGQLRQLQALILEFNALSCDLPPELGKLTELTMLDLGSNAITGGIPKSFSGLKQLTHLSVYDNRLTHPLPAGLAHLQYLDLLNVRGNDISGRIPASFGFMPNLHTFIADSNRLSGAVPESLTNLKNLGMLYLDNNLLTGSAAHLAEIESLDALTLEGNNFDPYPDRLIQRFPNLID